MYLLAAQGFLRARDAQFLARLCFEDKPEVKNDPVDKSNQAQPTSGSESLALTCCGGQANTEQR